MTRFRASAVLIAVLLFVRPGIAQKDPPAGDILKLASDYLASWAARVSGVSLEEEYTLLDVSGSRLVSTRRITSDLVLLNLNGRITGLRDPFAVDSNAIRERTPRITSLLAKPSEAAWAQAQAYAGESLRYFQEDLIVRLNGPTQALQFVATEYQPRVTWKIEGRKKIGGIETVGLRFQETKVRPPKYILQTRGDAVASGKLWVDPATGRIHRTELWMESDSESAHIVVDYARDAALDLWLPSSMVEKYEVTERVGTDLSTQREGTPGLAKRAYDCRASYSHARLTPIGMRVTK